MQLRINAGLSQEELAQRKSGPDGKLKKVFEEASRPAPATAGEDHGVRLCLY